MAHHTQKLLLAAVQCKKYEEVGRDCLLHELRTVSPPWFWRSKDVEVSHSRHFKQHKTLLSAPFVQNYPDCPALAEKSCWRRSHPFTWLIMLFYASLCHGPPGLDRSLEVTRKQGKQSKMSEQGDLSELDPDCHPPSSLNLENFVTISQIQLGSWGRGWSRAPADKT